MRIAALVQGSGPALYAYATLYSVEATDKEWDIKKNINKDLGKGIILCGATCGWYDYSTIGNIQFGYVAGLIGINKDIGDAAGGFLNQKDRIEDGLGVDWGCLTCDDPADQAAVDFGYYLAEKYPNGITYQEFQAELSLRTDLTSQFQRPPNGFPEPYPAAPQQVEYDPYEFDNK